MPDSFIDLEQLYGQGPSDTKVTKSTSSKTTSGSASFRIPNVKWLVDNKWIDDADASHGPFFVKKLRLFPLPFPTNGQNQIANEAKFVSETRVLKNSLNGKNYDFAVILDIENFLVSLGRDGYFYFILGVVTFNHD